MNKNINKKGFTLLELLIVIAILAVLGAIVIFMLNPAETLKKARDSQRISDLSTIKTALGIYITSKKSPQLDGVSGTANVLCIGGTGQDTIWYSVDTATEDITDETLDTTASSSQVATAVEVGEVDGTGWIPVNLGGLAGGSPISNFPQDPTNDIDAQAAVTSSTLAYRYACDNSPLGFEINAALESEAYTVDDNLARKDGGNNTGLYEVGSILTILSGASTF